MVTQRLRIDALFGLPAQDRATVQRVVATGLAVGTQVVLNAGNLAGTVCTVHHEDLNFQGNHVYFINIPGFAVQVAVLLTEPDPLAAAAA